MSGADWFFVQYVRVDRHCGVEVVIRRYGSLRGAERGIGRTLGPNCRQAALFVGDPREGGETRLCDAEVTDLGWHAKRVTAAGRELGLRNFDEAIQ